MIDSEILRPTKERERLADHIADDGSPTKDQPYIRAARLGTAWDRYKRDRDSTGRLLGEEEMILKRCQIATGAAYAEAFEGSEWGYPTGSKFEPGISSSFKGEPAGAIDRGLKVRDMEALVRPRYLVSLLRAVLIEGFSAETWATATGRHPKSGIALFRAALDAMGGE